MTSRIVALSFRSPAGLVVRTLDASGTLAQEDTETGAYQTMETEFLAIGPDGEEIPGVWDALIKSSVDAGWRLVRRVTMCMEDLEDKNAN